MSHAGQKRKRPLPSTPNLFRAAVQSVFSQAAYEKLEQCQRQKSSLSQPQCVASASPASTARLRRSVLSNLCDGLECLSKSNGQSQLSAVKNELRKLTYSTSDLVSLLFTDEDNEEDFEMAPPLCVIVDLLRDSYLCLADVPNMFFLQRAVLEVAQPNICVCRPGQQRGILLLVHYLLDGNRSSRCDAFLRQFFLVFLDSTLSQIDANARFRLAKLVIEFLYNECVKYGEFVDMFVQWVRQVVTPSQFLDRPERDKTDVIVR